MADETDSALKITINEAWCKGCGYCVEFCPTDVLAMEGVLPVLKDLEACTACMLCDFMCPDFAITVEGKPPKKKKKSA